MKLAGLLLLLQLLGLAKCQETLFDKWMVQGGLDIVIQPHQRQVDFSQVNLENLERSYSPLIELLQGTISTKGKQKISLLLFKVFNTLDENEILLNATDDFKTSLSQCVDQWKIFINDTVHHQIYALQMWDSWGIPESGILEGNVRWPGHYHECMDAKGPQVKGRWCQIHQGFKAEENNSLVVDIKWASCVPSQCTKNSLKFIFERIFQEIKFNIPIFELYYPKPYTSLTTIDVIGIVITFILATCVLIGTIVDIIHKYEAKAVSANEQTQKEAYSKIINETISGKLSSCFSLHSNMRKIFSMKKRPGDIPVLDGMRFISMTWVILGHSIMAPASVSGNPIYAGKQIRKHLIFMMAAENGSLSVDTFLFLSGLLVTYLAMKHLTKTNGKMNIAMMYIMRYLRLTPAYAYILLMSMGLMKFFGYGPYWEKTFDCNYHFCENTWWTNLLYINNIYPAISYCLTWGWYLAVDTQYYLLSPLFAILIYRSRKVGIFILSLFCLASVLTTGILSLLSDLQPMPSQTSIQMSYTYKQFSNDNINMTYRDKYMYDIYTTPWSRFGAYGIGMLTGYMLFACKQKVRISKVANFFGWLISSVSAMAIVYGTFEATKNEMFINKYAAALYNALARPIWACCLSWVVVACVSGYGGPVRSFLNWKGFSPLSRLTYGTYLVHMLVELWYLGIQEATFSYHIINIIYLFLGTTVLSIGCSILLALLVEWPFMGITNLAFKYLTGNRQRKVTPEDRLRVTIAAELEAAFKPGQLVSHWKQSLSDSIVTTGSTTPNS